MHDVAVDSHVPHSALVPESAPVPVSAPVFAPVFAPAPAVYAHVDAHAVPAVLDRCSPDVGKFRPSRWVNRCGSSQPMVELAAAVGSTCPRGCCG